MADLRVAVAGLGAIGSVIARTLDAGVPGLALAAVGARDTAKAQAFAAGLRSPVPVRPVSEFAGLADIVVECAPAAALPAIGEPALRAGRKLVVLSCGALLDHWHLVELARRHGGQILVPTGALLGLDAVSAAAEGTIHSVRMTTRKPPQALAGAPHLVANGIDVSGLEAPLRVFSGSAREAIRGFPANVNVAVALSLAGVGPDRTMIDLWADPGVSRNIHEIELDSDSVRLSMRTENLPSANPRTGRVTPLSAIALLRRLGAPLRVGT